MKIQSPGNNSIISWIIMGTGILLALIGAAVIQDYKINLWLWAGLFVIIAGIVYHLLLVRCPYCGHSLAGYRPFPKECPECHKSFDE